MVRMWLIIFILLFSYSLAAQSVTVDAFINQGNVHFPIKGSITITHEKNKSVDLKSFQLENKPLTVSFSEEVGMASNSDIVISIYQFELEAKAVGSYTLPPISVKVGKTTYQSFPARYEVVESEEVPQTVAPQTPKTPIDEKKESIFRLEAFIEGPSPLYPGQRAHLGYRISYNQNIDLTASQFPLLDAKEFKKIGEIKVTDYEKNGLTYQKIAQEIEANKSGTFHFDSSSIEGYAYASNIQDKKVYLGEKLHAEATSLDVIVAPFPIQNQPASFNGIVGENLNAKLKMLLPAKMQVGDEIRLELTVTGPTNLAEMRLPLLECQPGFSGFFELNDLPPAAQMKGTSKVFNIELRPLSLFVHSVPIIELSAFNPSTSRYIIWRSAPIPLTIIPSETKDQITSYEEDLPDASELIALKQKLDQHRLLPSNFRPATFSANLFIEEWIAPYLFFLIPLTALAWLLQWHGYRYLINHPRLPRRRTSQDLLKKALYAQRWTKNPTQAAQLLQEALILHLKEKGYSFNETEKAPSEITQLLFELEAVLYGHQDTSNVNQIVQRAVQLIKGMS